LVGVKSGTAKTYTPTAIGGTTALGARYTLNTATFDGLLDDARLYDEALPDWKIRAIYNFGEGSEACQPWQRLIQPVIHRTLQPLIGAA
jgi:hypothetical protein